MPIREFLRAPRAAPAPDPAPEPEPEPDPVPLITAAELAAELGADATRAGHILATVEARVEQYASGAPDAIKREALIRFAGWLYEAPAAGVRSERTGDIETTYSPTMTGGFRASGAAALLAPWRERRAGGIARSTE